MVWLSDEEATAYQKHILVIMCSWTVRQGYSIQQNKEPGIAILSRMYSWTVRLGYSIQRNKEPGIANLRRRSLHRGAVSRQWPSRGRKLWETFSPHTVNILTLTTGRLWHPSESQPGKSCPSRQKHWNPCHGCPRTHNTCSSWRHSLPMGSACTHNTCSSWRHSLPTGMFVRNNVCPSHTLTWFLWRALPLFQNIFSLNKSVHV